MAITSVNAGDVSKLQKENVAIEKVPQLFVLHIGLPFRLQLQRSQNKRLAKMSGFTVLHRCCELEVCQCWWICDCQVYYMACKHRTKSGATIFVVFLLYDSTSVFWYMLFMLLYLLYLTIPSIEYANQSIGGLLEKFVIEVILDSSVWRCYDVMIW